MTRFLSVAVFALSTVALQAQTPTPAPAPPPAPAAVAGKWLVSMNVGGQAFDMTCEMTLKGAELTGTCAGAQGEMAVNGTVEGTTVAWQVLVNYEGQPLTVIYTGALETPDKITGTVDVRPMNVGGDFVATRPKP